MREERAKARHSRTQASKSVGNSTRQYRREELLPDCVAIYEDFVTADEAEALVEGAYAGTWSEMTNRRVQNLGGVPHPDGMISEPLPEWLVPLCSQLVDCGAFQEAPNHCLLNEYLPAGGIAPHRDGPRYICMCKDICINSSLRRAPQEQLLE